MEDDVYVPEVDPYNIGRREFVTVSGKAGLVIQAADGSVEERARFIGGRDVFVAAPLDGAQLGRIFGREQAVHVAVALGPLATKIQNEILRLAAVAGGRPSGQ